MSLPSFAARRSHEHNAKDESKDEANQRSPWEGIILIDLWIARRKLHSGLFVAFGITAGVGMTHTWPVACCEHLVPCGRYSFPPP
jgi:hypothetical protein